jgi:hypothetical protein
MPGKHWKKPELVILLAVDSFVEKHIDSLIRICKERDQPFYKENVYKLKEELFHKKSGTKRRTWKSMKHVLANIRRDTDYGSRSTVIYTTYTLVPKLTGEAVASRCTRKQPRNFLQS